jgi:fibronectin-binding autotransporter adhesin
MQQGKIASTNCASLSRCASRSAALSSLISHRFANRWASAILPLIFLMAPFGTSAYANGTADYIDFNGTTAGFGSPTGTISQGASIWDTSSAGTGTSAAFTANDQMTFGVTSTDLQNAIFSVGMTGSAFNGLVVNSNSANITLTGTTETKLTSNQTWTVTAGSTLIDNSTGLDFGSVALTLSGGGAISFEVTPVSNGTGLVTENGLSTLVVNLAETTGATPFTGGFTLTQGTLNFATSASANAFSQFASGKLFMLGSGTNNPTIDNTSGSPMTLSVGSAGYSIGGSFAFTGSSPLSFGTAAVNLTASPTITINSAANPLTIGGAVTGAAFGITEAGVGTLILSGNNTAYGTANVTTTTISGGTLQIGNAGALGAGSVSIAGTSSLTSGPTLAFALTGSPTISNNIGLTGNISTGVVSFISVASGDSVTLGGNITGNSGQLCVTGGGTLILSSTSNQYGSGTVIGQAGGSSTTLEIGSFSSVAGKVVKITNGTLEWTGNSSSQSDTVVFQNTPANCAINVAQSDTLSLSSQLTGSAGNSGFTVSGPGTLVLSGANTYTGGTIVSAGILNLSNSSAVQDSVVTLSGGSIVFSSTVSPHSFTFGDLSGSGDLALKDNATPTPHAVSLTIGGSNDSPTYSGILSGAGSLTKVGLGALTLSGANSYAGLTTVSAGSLTLSGSAASGTMTTSGIAVNGGTFAFSPTAATTLGLTGSTLTLGGGDVNFDIGSAGLSDEITANTLTLTANSAFSFTAIGEISSGTTYTLATYNTLNNSGPYTISGQTVGRLILTPTIGANAITVTPTVAQAIWNSSSGGNWSSGPWLNYTPGVAGDTAMFGSLPGLLSSATIVVDMPETVGSMTFNNTTASYTIGTAGSSNLTLDNGSLSAMVAVQNGGSHTIAENVALNSNVLISIDPTASLSIGGALSDGANGPSSLTKTGSGTLNLTGLNSYSGGTNVDAGQLAIGSSGTLGATNGALVVNGTGILDLGGTSQTVGAVTIGGGTIQNGTLTGSSFASTGGAASAVLAGASASLSQNSGTLTLSGANTYGGGTIVSAGTLDITGSGTLGATTGTLAVNGVGILDLGGTTQTVGAVTFGGGTIQNGTLTGSSFASTGGTASAVLAGAGASLAQNAGTLTLSGTNTYGGGTTVSAGNLDITGSGTLGATTGTLVVNGVGILDLGGTTQIVGAVTIGGGTIQNGTLSGTSFISNGGGTVSAVLAGAGASLTQHSGTLTLSGANTYGGGTIVSAGTLDITGSGTLGATTGTLAVNGTGVLDLGGTTQTVGAVTFGGGTIQNGTLTGSSMASTGGAASAVLAGAGASLAQNAGTLTLSGANTYSGGTTVSGGTLNLADSLAVQNSIVSIGAGNIVFSSTVPSHAFTFGDLSGSGNLALQDNTTPIANAISLTIGGSADNSTYSGVLCGPGSLAKIGAGTTVLTGANTYTGGTAINAGVLQLGDQTSTTAALSSTGGIAVNGTFVVEPAANTSIVVGNSLTGSGNIIVNGSATSAAAPSAVAFTGDTTGFTGTWTINGGCLQLGGSSNVGAATDTITVNGTSIGGGEFSFTTGTIANPITINGIGTNEAAGNLGAIRLAGGTYSGPIMLGSNASISAFGRTGTISGSISDLGGGYALTFGTQSTSTSGGTICVTSANNPYSGGTVILGTSVGANAIGALGTGSITLSNSPSYVAATALTENIPNALTSTNSLVVQAGTATLSQSNNYSGGTTLSGGTLLVNNSGALGSGALVINGGTIDNTSGSPVAVSGISGISIGGSFTFTGSNSLDLGASPVTLSVTPTITCSSSANTLTLGGTISGTGFALTGPGTLILAGNSSYMGCTQVNSGTLMANATNALGSGNLAINADGNGPASAVNINANQSIGGLSGALTNGAAATSAILAIAGGQTLAVNQNGTGTFPGTLNNSGTLVMQGAGTLEFTGPPVLNSSSALVVTSGTLRFNNVTAGSGASVGSDVTATVVAGATLQLAGTVSALSDASNPASVANITTHGTGNLLVTGTNQSVGTVIGDAGTDTDGATVYSGSTVVGDGNNPADLTATQILQATLTINAGSTVTIRPSGPGISIGMTASTTDSNAVAGVAPITPSVASSETSGESATTIDSEILADSFSSQTSQRLENRLAAIERLAVSDPGLEVSLLGISSLSSYASSLSFGEPSAGMIDSGASALASESGSIPLGAAAVFSPSSYLNSNPAAVPEPSTLLLAASAVLGLALLSRRRIS